MLRPHYNEHYNEHTHTPTGQGRAVRPRPRPRRRCALICRSLKANGWPINNVTRINYASWQATWRDSDARDDDTTKCDSGDRLRWTTFRGTRTGLRSHSGSLISATRVRQANVCQGIRAFLSLSGCCCCWWCCCAPQAAARIELI